MIIKNIFSQDRGSYLISAASILTKSTVSCKKPVGGRGMLMISDFIRNYNGDPIKVYEWDEEGEELLAGEIVIKGYYYPYAEEPHKLLPLPDLSPLKKKENYNGILDINETDYICLQYTPSEDYLQESDADKESDQAEVGHKLDLDLVESQFTFKASHVKEDGVDKFRVRSAELAFRRLGLRKPEKNKQWKRPQIIVDLLRKSADVHQWLASDISVERNSRVMARVDESFDVKISITEKDNTNAYTDRIQQHKSNVDHENKQEQSRSIVLNVQDDEEVALQKPTDFVKDVFTSLILRAPSLIKDRSSGFEFLDNVAIKCQDGEYSLAALNMTEKGKEAEWTQPYHNIHPQRVLGPGKMMKNPYHASLFEYAVAKQCAILVLERCVELCREYCEGRDGVDLSDLMNCSDGQTKVLTRSGIWLRLKED